MTARLLKMDILFQDFQTANEQGSGALLAATVSPTPPAHYLNRLESIWNSTNYASAERDIGHSLTNSMPGPIKFPSQEITIWTDIYVAYWKSLGQILAAQEHSNDNADWGRCYESWKELSNAVIRGYTSGVLEAWTLPVLYMAGKHLRVFAIKADESGKKNENGLDMDMGGMGDDIAGDYGKNVKLEDAARVINRMFTLCISDRYVVNPVKEAIQLIAVRSRPLTCCLLFTELRWRNHANGASTIQQTYSSRLTSNSILSAFPRISFALCQPPKQTCLTLLLSPSPTL